MGRVALICLLSCACNAYQPGSFHGVYGEFPGKRRTVGCLDVAVAPAYDAEARGTPVELTFANRCDGVVRVDLAAIRATAHYETHSAPAAVYDPRGEIVVGRLDGRLVGREILEYLPTGAEDSPPRDLCLDLSRLDRDAPPGPPVLVCLHRDAPGLAYGEAR